MLRLRPLQRKYSKRFGKLLLLKIEKCKNTLDGKRAKQTFNLVPRMVAHSNNDLFMLNRNQYLLQGNILNDVKHSLNMRTHCEETAKLSSNKPTWRTVKNTKTYKFHVNVFILYYSKIVHDSELNSNFENDSPIKCFSTADGGCSSDSS